MNKPTEALLHVIMDSESGESHKRRMKMPVGLEKGSIKCSKCIDCEPMRAGNETCFRCYGEVGGFPLKRDFAINTELPGIAPTWCPHRKCDTSPKLK